MCLFKYFSHNKNKRIARWRNIVFSSKRLGILMALNECAVHVYVIIIEKKESCDSFKSFSLLFDVLWRFDRNKLCFF